MRGVAQTKLFSKGLTREEFAGLMLEFEEGKVGKIMHKDILVRVVIRA